MNKAHVSTQVLQFLMENPGKTLRTAEIAEAIGLDRHSVATSLANMFRRANPNSDWGQVRKPGRGHYLYDPNYAPEGSWTEVERHETYVLLRGPDQRLFYAKPLEGLLADA
jgi:hypothetical protein